jgi:hypothetical protein
MNEEKALRANRDMLVLLDQAIAAARQNDGDIALATKDLDSFMPYTSVVIGADDVEGILIPGGSPATVSDLGPWFGTLRGEGDGAFIVTHVNACLRQDGLVSSNPPLFQSLTDAVTFIDAANTTTVATPLWDIRLTDTATGRDLTIADGSQSVIDGRLLSPSPVLTPNGYPLRTPFTLPRDSAVRVRVGLSQPLTIAGGSPAGGARLASLGNRVLLVFSGYKVMGN